MSVGHGPLPAGIECCCSPDCVEITPPEIEIYGWTGTGWMGGPCCWCQNFFPNEPLAYQTLCSEKFADHTMTQECEWEERARERARPLAAVNALLACPLPEEYCCPGLPIVIANVQRTYEFNQHYKLLVAYRPKRIKVCISYGEVTCTVDGVPTTSNKWIIESVYFYEVRVFYSFGSSIIEDKIVTENYPTCFDNPYDNDENPGANPPACCRDEGPDLIDLAACTIENLNNFSGWYPPEGASSASWEIPILNQEICYERRKFFDVLPTGSVPFGNGDINNNCTFDFCGASCVQADEPDVCISVTTLPIGMRPCWCDTDFIITQFVYSTSVPNRCGEDTCLPGGACGTRYSLWDEFDCTVLTTICCPGCDFPDCYSYDTNCFTSVFTPEEPECTQFGGETPTNSICCSVCTDPLGVPPACYITAPPCTDVAADPLCCYRLSCEAISVVNEFKYEVLPPNAITHTRTITCTFTPQELCLPTPTWTVEFI